ncbi:MAG: DinB family protein [Ideonella sp.]
MIDTDYCRLMATYNGWMNRKVYAACAAMPESDLYADRSAFFKSIYLTLNHIAYADLAFLSRFTGEPREVPSLAEDLFGGFAALQAERQRIDDRLAQWVESLSADWLARSLTYTSKVDGLSRTVPQWVLVSHVFNHQTHHRGQVTTMLSQLGRDAGCTDIPFMQQFQGDA